MLSHASSLSQSKFVRSVVVVATGTAGAQAVNMAFAPVITRLYGPEAFGVLGTFMAVLAILTPLTGLSYPIAIVLPKKDSDAGLLAKLALCIALMMCSFAALTLIVFREPIADALNLQAVQSFFFLIPLAMLFSVCMAVTNQWAIRKKLFKLKAKVTVYQSLVVNFAKSGLGLINPIAASLVAVASFAALLHAFLLWTGIRQQGVVIFSDSDRTAVEMLRRHKDFAFFRTPQVLINNAGKSLPVLILVSLFGSSAAGFYALSLTVLAVPSALIGQSVADVFYPKFVETLHSGGSGKKLLVRACVSLFAVGAAPYLLVITLGPWLFSIVFGPDWQVAGDYARWMSLWLFMVLVTRPVIAAIPALSLQGAFLVIEVLAVLVRVVAMLVGYSIFGSALGVVIAFSLSNIVIYTAIAGFVISRA